MQQSLINHDVENPLSSANNTVNNSLLHNNSNSFDDNVQSDKSSSKAPTKDQIKYMYCSRFCILLFVVITVVILITMGLIICLAIFPHFAQRCADSATMEMVSGIIYNPTNDSIQLNATMKLENSGMFSAYLDGATADVYNDGVKLGTMAIPAMQTVGNQVAFVNISTKLNISNVTQFTISCRRNLKGQDDVWLLSSRHRLTMKIGHLSLRTHIMLIKNLLIQGSNIENFQTTNITILDATTDTLQVLGDVSFRMSTSGSLTYVMPAETLNIYVDNVKIGYSPMPTMTLIPNVINYFNHTSFIIQLTSDNRKVVEKFFSLYTMGTSQQIQLIGPSGSNRSVIHNVINQYVTVTSNVQSPLAFGSILTKETMNGWVVKANNTTKTIRGGYANMQNPFNVGLKITSLKAKTYFPDTIRYDVTISKLLSKKTFHCYPNKTNEYALLSIDHGIYKNNYSKNSVEIPANSKVTYFIIANPMSKADSEASCFNVLPFSCCYATLTTAYICAKNPQLKANIQNELNMSYIPTIVDANITVLINDRFEMETSYYQQFMPIYFGYEIYSGFIGDLELNCKDFVFY